MWCEIREGRDFFDWTKPVNWIVGNPPYSIFEDFLRHSFDLAENVVFIVPTNKVFQRQVIMEMVTAWGGIKAIMIYGSGAVVGFPFGFSVGTFHFKKAYSGKCELILGNKNRPTFQMRQQQARNRQFAQTEKVAHGLGIENE